jgi:hypothetical protein
MHHLSSIKRCFRAEQTKQRRLRRAAAALGAVVLGVGISIHLFAIHVSYWWLPLVIVLVLGHAAIISGIAWFTTRCGGNKHEIMVNCAGREHASRSHVLRNPRAYDWLARVITLGGERKFRQRTLDLAELQSGDVVLDVGCGTGTLLIEAAKRVGPSVRRTALIARLKCLPMPGAKPQRKASSQILRKDRLTAWRFQMPRSTWCSAR